MIRIAVLISGSGTTLKNLIDRAGDGRLPATIVQVISSRAAVGGLQHAARAGIPSQVIKRKDFADARLFSQAVFASCEAAGVDLVVMGGFLTHLLIPAEYCHRVMNIHPALIPAFCGHGFYGLRVHQAVIDHGVKISGCTVHFVDDQYDHGPIILQRPVPVLDDDTPQRLAERVFREECEAYPEAIGLFAEGRLSVVGRRVIVEGTYNAS